MSRFKETLRSKIKEGGAQGIVIEDCEIDKDSSRETEEIASRLENLFS